MKTGFFLFLEEKYTQAVWSAMRRNGTARDRFDDLFKGMERGYRFLDLFDDL